MENWKRIDRYQVNLKKLLGQGSYASVYIGRSVDTGESVAVKVIERRLFMDSYNLKNLQS
jgi:serine/threonine protein kinase